VSADLAVLIPPVVVCVAVLIAVGAFLRHEMAARRPGDEDDVAEPNRGAAGIDDPGIGGTVTGSTGETPNEGHAETTERGSAPRQ
jgi:hypothetical protein